MYCSNCGKSIDDSSVFCQFCGARTAQQKSSSFPFKIPSSKRPFARYSNDKKIAGVCGGVARYFDLDSSLVRAIWLLCSLLWGAGPIAYVVLWVAMPLDPAGGPPPEPV